MRDLSDLSLCHVGEWEKGHVEAGFCDGRKVICLVFGQVARAHELWTVIRWVVSLARIMT